MLLIVRLLCIQWRTLRCSLQVYCSTYLNMVYEMLPDTLLASFVQST